MYLPRGHLSTHIRQLATIDRTSKPRECPSLCLVEGLPGTKRIAAERKRHHRVIPVPPTVLAVHYFRLLGMQTQSDIGEPTPDCLPHLPGLTFGHTVDHRIVRETLEPDSRIFPRDPQIEAVMQEQISEQR